MQRFPVMSLPRFTPSLTLSMSPHVLPSFLLALEIGLSIHAERRIVLPNV